MYNKRWTPELVEEAKRLYLEEKLTMQEIGDKFGVCRERIRQVIGNVRPYHARRKPPKATKHLTRNSELLKDSILERRFRSNVKIDDETGCWIWTGSKNGPSKHAKMYTRCTRDDPAASVSPRRFIHYIKCGEYPKGYIRYSCGNNLCCNPDHEIKK